MDWVKENARWNEFGTGADLLWEDVPTVALIAIAERLDRIAAALERLAPLEVHGPPVKGYLNPLAKIKLPCECGAWDGPTLTRPHLLDCPQYEGGDAP